MQVECFHSAFRKMVGCVVAAAPILWGSVGTAYNRGSKNRCEINKAGANQPDSETKLVL